MSSPMAADSGGPSTPANREQQEVNEAANTINESKSTTPRRSTAAAHLPIPPEFLLIADLFKKPERPMPSGPPKNIEVLTRLAVPLRKHRKFRDELEEEEKALKARNNPVELPEPKNLEILKRLAEPLPKNKTVKFELIIEQEHKELENRLKSPPKSVTEPKNMEAILRLAAPLPRNVHKKFALVVEEEEAAKKLRAEKMRAARDQLRDTVVAAPVSPPSPAKVPSSPRKKKETAEESKEEKQSENQ